MNTAPPPSSGEPSRGESRRQMSLTHVFRAAAEERTARRPMSRPDADGRQIGALTQHRREGISAEELRRHLGVDLNCLMNTVRLDAAVPLDDAPWVQKSVVNFGFRDLSSVSRSRHNEVLIAQAIRQTLLDHEPRLIPESIEVAPGAGDDSMVQRLIFDIQAEIRGYPADIPLGFTAEIDLGAGKMKMKGLWVQK